MGQTIAPWATALSFPLAKDQPEKCKCNPNQQACLKPKPTQ